MPLKGEARTEYMRDYMRRRRAAERAGATKPAAPDHDALEARNAALEQELAQAKARIAEREKAGTVAAAEIAALKGELQDALGFRFARFAPRPRKPKVEKPPLPPDEERERIIKGLRTRVRNLVSELDATRELNNKIAMRTGDMPRTTRTAIDWVLQPDQRRNADEAAWDKACKGWNAWKNDSDKVRRQAR